MFCIIVFETTKNKSKVWLFMKIHILQTGEVMVAPSLAYNGNTGFNPQTHGLLLKSEDRVNIPVLSFLIQTGNKNILVDTGIKRELESEEPLSFDKQLKAIKAPLTFASTRFHLPKDSSLVSRLEELNLSPQDIDYVLLTHLDFENVSGVADFSSETKILVSRDEAKAAVKNPLRYSRSWWKNANISIFDWNGKEGPFEKSLDLLGDGSIILMKLYGHSAGMFGVKVTSENNKFTLLYSDAGYGELAWKELAPPAVTVDKEATMRSLEWVRRESLDKNCAYSLASHEATSMKVLRF